MILLTAATVAEVKPIIGEMILKCGVVTPVSPSISVLITGVGAVPTTLHLSMALQNHAVDFVINVGVAGAYPNHLEMGEVVMVHRDTFGDYGADDRGTFRSLFDLGLATANQFPFREGWMYCNHLDNINTKDYPKVTGITLSTTTGSQDEIDRLVHRYSPHIETMECASVFYTCLHRKVPFVCIRSISNRVEPRDKERWNLPLAIEQLGKATEEIIHAYLK